MSKLTIIKIDRGDFDSGFDATVRIEENGGCIYDKTHRLPPASHLPELYQSWKSGYSDRHLRGDNDGENTPLREKSNFRVIKIVEGQTTNLSIGELANDLERGLNEWLNSLERGVQEFREGLLENLSKTEEIRFVIETGDEILERLPWERWDFFDRYDNGDVVLNFPNRVTPRPGIQLKEKVKILVILGESSDIDVQADLHLLQDKLPSDAEILEPLIATSREKVDRALWDKKFDILFFAGHSSTDFGNGRGKFYINDTESLTVADLKEGLKRAIANGLKLAIFNSCDGIGLGRDLTDLQMPAIVVMREKIPDEAAQRFLEFFLKAFAIDGKTLSAGVTEAKKRLIGIEGRHPCASWLPVLCQHPEAEILTWESLREVEEKQQRRKLSLIQGLQVVLLASFIGTGIVTVTKELGWWQGVELKAFDLLMQRRPLEEPDSNLLLITIDNNDVNLQSEEERRGASLSDRKFEQLLKQLMPHQPRAIGLSIYRENSVGENYSELAKLMQSDRFFGICQYSSGEHQGIPAPPEVAANRQGFSNLLQDPDGIIRRDLLAVESPEPCEGELSLSLQLAMRFLADLGITPTKTPEGYIQLGDVVFKTLEKNSGGYHNIDATGHQVMLNFRNSDKIAETLTLNQVISGDFDPALVRDRIILIGTTDPSFNNHRWLTPYSNAQWPIREFTGVEVHANKVSQIISAVLDGRPLIGLWSDLGENCWIWLWSLVGSAIAWRFKCGGREFAAKADIGVASSCLLLLTGSLWLPLASSVFAAIATSGIAVAWLTVAQKSQQFLRVSPLLRLVLAQGGVLGILYGSCLLLLTGGTWVLLVSSAFASVISSGITIVWMNILETKQQ